MDEKSSLLPSGKKDVDHGTAKIPRRGSRFGPDIEGSGVRPSGDSISNIPQVLVPRHRHTLSAGVAAATEPMYKRHKKTSTVGGMGHARAPSFMQAPDGSISSMTPLEMGRHELYGEVPFLAVSGLQKKEHSLSVAFSSFAAQLDMLETDEYLTSTTGKGLNPEEKEQRLSQMSLLLLGELEEDTTTVTTPLIFAVLIASLLMLNAGYNTGVMNAPEAFVFPGHSTEEWSLAVSASCVGAPFGCVLAGKWADSRGRRGALLLITWLFIIGGAIQSLATSLYVVMIARTVIGLSSGASTVLVPIYLGELAPPNLRGVLGTMTQFFMVIGILLADVVGFALANETRWRWMFALTSVMALIQLLLTPLLLESPRWLLMKSPNSIKARFVIKKLRGFRYDEEVETEVEHYLGASKLQSSNNDGWENGPNTKNRNPTAEMFADKDVRLLVVSTLVLMIAQQFSGINAVFYYSGLFFDGVIDNPLVGTTLMGAVNVLATAVALLLMDRCGRRTLIMWSSAGMFLSCIVIVLALLNFFSKTVAIAGVASYVAFFEIGLGPIPWLIVAEMFDGKYVSVAMSVSSQLNWTCNFFVGLLFPKMNEILGPYSFGPFGVILFFTFLYAWIYLPETSGTTPAELQAQLVKKNAGVTYHNMDIEGMASSMPPSLDEWESALAALSNEVRFD